MDELPKHSRPILIREPDFIFLDGKSLRLFRDDSNKLRLTIDENRSYPDVKVVRAFPLSDPSHYIAFMNHADKVIGMVKDLEALDEQSQALARSSLNRHYFRPVIKRIVEMKEEYGAVYFDVDTEVGRREFVTKGIRDSLQDLGDGLLALADVDGNRFFIKDWTQMDQRSRRFLERII
ncbi:MAG TPA: DUF1854 domain-containing protein [bacterium]|nr:DUF1854 domain-containing protein [bacterium]